MKKLFEYTAKNCFSKQNLNIDECDLGTLIRVNRLLKLPHDRFDEATESIVIPDNQLEPLINALQNHSRFSRTDDKPAPASTIYELRYHTNDVYYVLMRSLDKSVIEKKIAEIVVFDKKTLETGREVDYYDHPISKFDGHWVEDGYEYYDIHDLTDKTWASELEIVAEKIWWPDDV